VVLPSTHGGNRGALDAAVAELDRSLQDAIACAPRGDVGPNPGRHSGAWLTSVMLALRPDLVELDRADPELRTELEAAGSKHGNEALKRFITSIVAGVRSATTTSTGTSPTPRAVPPTRCAPSATRSHNASSSCSPRLTPTDAQAPITTPGRLMLRLQAARAVPERDTKPALVGKELDPAPGSRTRISPRARPSSQGAAPVSPDSLPARALHVCRPRG
jgi:hypothetical protein